MILQITGHVALVLRGRLGWVVATCWHSSTVKRRAPFLVPPIIHLSIPVNCGGIP